MVQKIYKVYFSASDGNNYFITSGGSDYAWNDGKSTAKFSSPEDAKVGIRQFLEMRKLKGLVAYPVDRNYEQLSGKFIIKSVIEYEPLEQESDEPEIEIQERKKKSSKSKPKRKPVKKIIKKCKCK